MERQDLEERIERLEKVVEDSNEILHKLHRHQKLSTLFRFLRLIVIIVVALVAYYLIQPYVEATIGAYRSLQESVNQVREVGDKIPDLPDFGGIFGREG